MRAAREKKWSLSCSLLSSNPPPCTICFGVGGALAGGRPASQLVGCPLSFPDPFPAEVHCGDPGSILLPSFLDSPRRSCDILAREPQWKSAGRFLAAPPEPFGPDHKSPVFIVQEFCKSVVKHNQSLLNNEVI